MTGMLLAVAGAYGVHLLFTAWTRGWQASRQVRASFGREQLGAGPRSGSPKPAWTESDHPSSSR